MLSDRIRDNTEAAPWVIEEVKRLEQRIAELEAELAEANKEREVMRRTIDFAAAFDAARTEAENTALRAALSEGVLASHDGKVPNRQWVMVQSWLYPGDKIVLVCGDAAKEE